MKTVIILYMPGHAGKFLSRLFALDSETMPVLPRQTLIQCIEKAHIPDNFDRLKSYRFSSALLDFNTWQEFHQHHADFKDSSMYQLLNIFCKEKFSRVVFHMHPHEFIADFDPRSTTELYYVDLDLGRWGSWVDSQQQKLNFYHRPDEREQFHGLIEKYKMQPISLDRLLENQQSFLTEYNRVCGLMGIVPLPQQALLLRQDWMSVRVGNQYYKDVVHAVSRPFNDEFTYDLFVDLVKSYPRDKEAYYFWNNHITVDLFFKHAPLSSSVVFIGIKDVLLGWADEEFNWWKNKQLLAEKIISDMVKTHPDKKFVLFVSMENLEITLKEPNLYIIPWGGDWVNQRSGYTKLPPVLNKNFQSEKTFISLNRNSRDHRVVALSYLFGSGVAESGVVSCLFNDRSTPILDQVNWRFGPEHDDIRTKILTGFDLLQKSNSLLKDKFLIYHEYGSQANDNIGNFENRLRSLYQDSFVEIVSETCFSPGCFMLTEKTAHAFYGCNFPIILGGVGAVAHLRELGLDVFDDVVDHGYDLIDNPFDRIVTAIESNRKLLTDPYYAKQSWKNCALRFERNVEVMRDIYSWYEQRTRQKFAETLELIG